MCVYMFNTLQLFVKPVCLSLVCKLSADMDVYMQVFGEGDSAK